MVGDALVGIPHSRMASQRAGTRDRSSPSSKWRLKMGQVLGNVDMGAIWIKGNHWSIAKDMSRT